MSGGIIKGYKLSILMADVTIGARLQLDGKSAENSVKSIKTQLREAQQEVVKLSEKFGATSKEAMNAAKRAAELKDSIGDAKNLIDAFNPDQKFAALSQSLSGVLGGFTALTGAMGLLGVESEDTQKMLLKVQSAMALSQGLNQVGDAIQSFKNLGTIIQSTTIFQKANNAATIAATTIQKAFGVSVVGTGRAFTILKGAIAATGIGLLIIGIGALVSKISAWTSGTDGQKAAQDSLNKSLERYNQLIDQELKGIDYVIKARKLRAQLAGASEKELSEIEATGNNERLAALENNLNRIKELKNSPEFAKADLETVEKVNQEYLKANRDYWDEVQKQEVDGLQKQVDAKNKIRSGASGKKDKGLSAADQFALDSKKKLAAEQFFLEQDEFRKSLEAKKLNAEAVTEIDNDRFMKSSALQEAETLAYRNNVEARAQLTEYERAVRIEAAQSVGMALGALSDLVGKQTAAGKVLGIAQATINTFIGATEVLRAKSVLPEPFGTISKIANVAAIIATGLSAVKNIVKTKVPGYSAGGGGSNVSASAPVTPQLPNATRTTLDQQQLNQIGNATVRAFVVESDVTNNQERIRRLNRAARL